MNERQDDARLYCPYYKPDSTCALLHAMTKTDKRCKVMRGEESIPCRYLNTQVAKR
ncbi:hypothetical protein [Paenibacillus helianthi]|uniref:hypothetical protein n=1 Tax=Paenibacillus helianthi TaxID=1349432 RepID=UPI00142D7DC7|nr:hypothetical protein [Paenibacillus helianthi]